VRVFDATKFSSESDSPAQVFGCRSCVRPSAFRCCVGKDFLRCGQLFYLQRAGSRELAGSALKRTEFFETFAGATCSMRPDCAANVFQKNLRALALSPRSSRFRRVANKTNCRSAEILPTATAKADAELQLRHPEDLRVNHSR